MQVFLPTITRCLRAIWTQRSPCLQENICTLNDGVSPYDYAAFFKRYRKWASKNDAELASVRQFPFATHNNANNPYLAEFVDFLITDLENAGTSWDEWMSGKTGQKLNAERQETPSCSVKCAAMFTQWADVDAINSDDRVVTWNWCTRS